MTEVPEHLLRRAKERRAAMTGEPAGGDDAPAGDAGSSKAVEPAAAASPAPSGGGGSPAAPAAPVPPPYTGPPQLPPRKQRVPAWAMPVLVALPLWAILYGGAFGERKSNEEGPVQLGATVYRSQGCSGCHGPAGTGGVGPAMTDVVKTFPEFQDHVDWVKNGSAEVKGQPYGAEGKVATGGMPPFPNLTEEELTAVVCHERVTYGGESPPPPECEEGASPDAGEGGGGEEEEGDSASSES